MTSETTIPSHSRKPRHGDQITITIKELDSKGQGLGRFSWPPFGEFQVAVRHAPPGSQATVEVVRRRGNKIDARRLEWIDKGPHAVEPRCRHFGVCGGCSFQNLVYSEQLLQLQSLVEKTLADLGLLGEGVEAVAVEPVIGMQDPFAYRNKMDFTFGSKRWVEAHEGEDVKRDFGVGLHVPFRHDKVLDVQQCSIAFDGADAILNTARELSLSMELTPWNLKEHSGLLRHLVLRQGKHTGQVLVYLVTSEEASEQIRPFVRALVEAHPQITSVVQGIHSGLATVAWGEWDQVLFGPGTIQESLLGKEFTIQPKSFFQTNTVQAERLIEVVQGEVAKGDPQVVHDLYCGTGILGLMVTPPGGRLVGFEKIASAVEDARKNAVRLGHPDAEFIEGDVLESMAQASESPDRPTPDVVIVDPPRAGLHPKMIPAVHALGSKRLVYVSCNVKNAARDILGLYELGWRLVRVQALDLFPHTPHVECVLTLERRP